MSSVINATLAGFKAILYHIDVATFMVLLMDLEKFADAVEWGERIAQLFEKPIDVSGNLFNVEVKVGIFEIDPPATRILTPSALMTTPFGFKAGKGVAEDERRRLRPRDGTSFHPYASDGNRFGFRPKEQRV